MWVLLLWFGLQLLSSLMQGAGAGGVAFRAHVGGFLAGMLLIPVLKHRNVRLFQPLR
jgi:membrane associated rhomboid family serine protease